MSVVDVEANCKDSSKETRVGTHPHCVWRDTDKRPCFEDMLKVDMCLSFRLAQKKMKSISVIVHQPLRQAFNEGIICQAKLFTSASTNCSSRVLCNSITSYWNIVRIKRSLIFTFTNGSERIFHYPTEPPPPYMLYNRSEYDIHLIHINRSPLLSMLYILCWRNVSC